MKYVFIDANIWLSLYDFSHDDLEEFEKLSNYLDSEIKLLIPKQVHYEVRRNRENKINDVLNKFDKFDLQIPNICKGYEESCDFISQTNELKAKHRELVKKIRKDALAGALKADEVINQILENVDFLDCDSILECAKLRFDVGNPPGKDKKYGDAINWECLLKFAPDDEDIYFISADKDYRSVLNGNSFIDFLMMEWKEKKDTQLHYYKSLREFFKDNVRAIELKTENEKEDLISDLDNSGSFSTTHSIISKLQDYTSWTLEQFERLCDIAKYNLQVGWIIKDSDVSDFYSKLLSNYSDSNSESVKWVRENLSLDNE